MGYICMTLLVIDSEHNRINSSMKFCSKGSSLIVFSLEFQKLFDLSSFHPTPISINTLQDSKHTVETLSPLHTRKLYYVWKY